LKSRQITRQALGLKRETLPASATAADTEALRQSERHSFRIELVNGEKFLGTTLGYVSALCGLFLYFPEPNGDVVRCFVPAQAAKTCSIDAPIGEVLIKQKAVSREAIEAAGATLRYLPQYSPDLDPIEMALAKFKALLRKAAERSVRGLWHRLGSLIQSFSPQECANYLRHAGYAAT
jgi:hypothetical protein